MIVVGGGFPPETYVCEIYKVDITMKKMDGDKDGRVSFADYTEMVGPDLSWCWGIVVMWIVSDVLLVMVIS